MKKYEVSQIVTNFTKQTKSQAILFYSQASYLMNNVKTFREIMFSFLKQSYCEKGDFILDCDCKNCQLIKNLNHPDVKIITPVANGGEIPKFFMDFFFTGKLSEENINENKLAINKDQVIEVQNFINSSLPNIGRNKTVIFWLPEYMNNVAMNLLLKTIEEPPKNTNFLFFTENRDILLPTLLSRTMQFFIRGEEDKNGNFFENMQMFVEWMRMCYAKKYVKLIPFIEDFSKRDKEFQKSFFVFLGFILEQLWLSSLKMYSLMQVVDKDLDTINKMASIFSAEAIQKIYESATRGLKNIKRNSNVKLVMMNLSLDVIENK